MTIKKRLFVSNIFMLVIPIFVSMIISYSIVYVFSGSSSISIEDSYPKSKDIINNFEKTQDADALISDIKAFNEDYKNVPVFMMVIKDGKPVYPDNAAEVISSQKGFLSIDLLNNATGSMYVNNTRLFLEKHHGYTIVLMDTHSIDGFRSRNSGGHYAFVVLGVTFFAVLLTNRALTYFLVRRVTVPLDALSNGVRRLGEGNLEYRISYAEKDEFTSVCNDFNVMAGHLEDLIGRRQKDDASRKELLAGISHDLRTPLTSIKAYVEGLLDGVANDEATQIRYLKTIRAKAEDIDRMVDKLFLFSKLDLDEYPFHPETLDIGAELSSMTEALGEEYESKGMTLEIGENLQNTLVYVDPLQLRLALTNVLENSVNYKNKDHGHIVISCTQGGSNLVSIRVTDDGPGVPPETLTKLFDVFYRGDSSRNNPSKGSGLGLAITARILQRLGGSIRAENAPHGGLSIIIQLPRYREGMEEYL